MLSLDVPYENIDKSAPRYSKLEKAVLAVSAVAVIGLVGLVCCGTFSAPVLGAPVSMRSRVATVPRLSMGQVRASMDRSMAVSAQQVNQMAELKKTDGRLGKIAFLAVPVVAWVGFNILGPAQNQLDGMAEKTKQAPKTVRRRGLLTGIASAAAGAAALKEADAEEILRALDEVNYEKF
eukprot:CAMPEP_0114526212 /NCGR_PEP_ID=MMETSP0109-20121206/22885_1 /TAXON_ID=29199 /ORGANISM="Chlorarachnion reptans, Strain CCCM449" /LENGTH=178 /DNA_ID=CAMNT_0001707941 /DNA_START=71 /DNA_END=607 /DNA_ORIENTATION=+